MDSVITVLCLAAGAYFVFRYGKRLGSQKAFRVGYDRAKRRFGRRKRLAKR